MQKAHLAVRACKLSGFMQRRIGPSVQICGKAGLPFAEVPCLHQSNLHMKRKLREWRTQKCNPCFGAESPPLRTGQQTTRFHAAPYGTVSANLRKVGNSFRRGTVLHQSNLHMEGKLREWRTQKCDPCFGAESVPRSTGQ